MGKVRKLQGIDNNTEKGDNYILLFQEFLKPFLNDFKNNLNIEKIIFKTVDVWNSANIQIAFEEENYEEVFEELYGEDDDFEVLKKMAQIKLSKYDYLIDCIKDVEIIEENNRTILKFKTENTESYLMGMMSETNGFADAFKENEEGYINRSALVLTIKEPFVNWLNKMYAEDDHSEVTKDSNVYLIDDIEDVVGVEKWLKKKYKLFFEKELEAWITDKKYWPKKRTYKMFTEWFSIKISTAVYDLKDSPVSKSYDL